MHRFKFYHKVAVSVINLILCKQFNVYLISDNVSLLYPFFYRPMFDVFEDGWQAFLAESEFSRVKSHSENWRLSHVNKDYKVSLANILDICCINFRAAVRKAPALC